MDDDDAMDDDDMDDDDAADLCFDDGNEENDDSNGTTTITTNASGFVSCPLDEDWFEFTLNPDETVTFTINYYAPEGELGLTVYDNTLNVIALGIDAGGTVSAVYTSPGASNYFAQVTLQNDLGSNPGTTYDIDFTVVNPPACIDDLLEDNDTAVTGTIITPSSLDSGTSCPGDEDWFEFSVAPGDSVEFDLQFSHAEGNIDMYLQDAAGNLIVDALSLNDNEYLNENFQSGGVFYPRRHDGGHRHHARQHLHTRHDADARQWRRVQRRPRTERRLVTATGIAPPSIIAASCPNNEDWWSVALATGDTVDFNLAFTQTEEDIDAYLVDLGHPIRLRHLEHRQ